MIGKRLLIISFTILLLGVFLNTLIFRGSLLIAGGEDYQLLNPAAFFYQSLFAWDTKTDNFGEPSLSTMTVFPYLTFFKILASFGLNTAVAQRVVFTVVFVATFLFMYLVIYESLILEGKGIKRDLAAIVGSLLYLLNIYIIMIPEINQAGRLNYMAAPLLLWIVIKGMNASKKQVLYAFAFGLASLFLASSFVNFALAAPTVIVVGTYAFYTWIISDRKWANLRFLLLCALSAFLSNVWWIFVFVENALKIKDAAVSVLSTGDVPKTAPLYDVLRFMGLWGFRSVHYIHRYYEFSANYDKPLLLLTTFGMTALLLAPLVLKNVKVGRGILFFYLLFFAGIFLVKGAETPFGGFYTFLWNNISIMKAFRNPWAKFTPITVFAASVLLAYSYLVLSERVLEKVKKRFAQAAIFLFFVALVILNAYPLLVGQSVWDKWNSSMRSLYTEIPDYWLSLQSFLVAERKSDSRIFIPSTTRNGYASYNWEFGHGGAPAVALLPRDIIQASPFNFSTADKVVNSFSQAFLSGAFEDKIKDHFGILAVDYVLQQNDLDWRFAEGTREPSFMKKLYRKFDTLAVSKSFGFFDAVALEKIPNFPKEEDLYQALYDELTNTTVLDLYKVDVNHTLPRIYASGTTRAINGGLPDDFFFDLALTDYKRGDAVFSNVEKQIFSSSLEPVEKVELGEKISTADILTPVSPDVSLPNATISTTSPFYSSVRFREWLTEALTLNKYERASLRFWYLTKRVVEIRNTVTAGNYSRVMELLADYLTESRNFREYVHTLRLSGDYESNKFLRGLAQEQYRMLLSLEPKIIGTNAQAYRDYKSVVDQMKVILMDVVSVSTSGKDGFGDVLRSTDTRGDILTLTVPVAGEYDLYFRSKLGTSQLFDYVSGDLMLDMQINERKADTVTVDFSKSREWLNVGKYPLVAGENSITLKRNSNVKRTFPAYTNSGYIEYQDGAEFILGGSDDVKFDIPLKMTDDDSGPLSVSFSYKLVRGSYRLSVANDKKETLGYVILEPSDEWTKVEKLIYLPETVEGDLDLVLESVGYDPSRGSELTLKEFKVERGLDLDYSVGVRVLGEGMVRGGVLPQVSFSKENPTKYKVSMTNVAEPFVLIFSDTYDPRWLMYIDTGKTTTMSFGGSFETIGLRRISDDKHLAVNGYMNAWLIRPEDLGGISKADVILEFSPQRYVYIGLVVSAAFILFVCLYTVVFFVYDRLTARK